MRAKTRHRFSESPRKAKRAGPAVLLQCCSDKRQQGTWIVFGSKGDGTGALLFAMFCLFIAVVSWFRLSEQLFRVDKWSVCRG